MPRYLLTQVSRRRRRHILSIHTLIGMILFSFSTFRLPAGCFLFFVSISVFLLSSLRNSHAPQLLFLLRLPRPDDLLQAKTVLRTRLITSGYGGEGTTRFNGL